MKAPKMPAFTRTPSSSDFVEIVTESRRRLLVIDDEADLCDVLHESLEPLHEVITTTDARAALAWLAAGERFDLILCDVRMPIMTGPEIYESLRGTNPEQASRVVLMSSDFPRRMEERLTMGPAPTLAKPFDVVQVRALMRDAKPRTPPS